MPAYVHDIDFSTIRDRSGGSTRLHLAHNKVVSFAHETPVRSLHRNIAALTSYQRDEAILAILVAFGLHLSVFALMPDAAHEEPLSIPEPIQVAWIGARQSQSDHIPAAPPKQKQPKAKLKPKPKTVTRVKTTPKAVLSTSAQSPTMASASPENTAIAAESAAKKPADAPSTKPTAKFAQPAADAAASNSQQPLTLPNLNAGYLNNPPPRYPEEAREQGHQGKVLVRALINTDGTVAELTLKRSSGHPSLDRSALTTVKKWRFIPARRGNSAVSAWIVVPISFSLEG